MLILLAIFLVSGTSSVNGAPLAEDSKVCMGMPSSYNYTAVAEKVSIGAVIDDISSFVSNFSKRFTEMKNFIDKHKNITEDMDINYFLFTSLKTKSPNSLKLSKESLSSSGFDPRKPTTVIVHGYTRAINLNNSSLSIMKDFLLKRSPHNVIIMNYTKYCQGPYTEAVQYSYLVAMNLANYLNFIVENSFVPAEQFHLIGISLGAQISGNAAKQILGLGRITGLDPAGPLFEIFPDDYRLNHRDALFVDVIHTGAVSFPYGLGMPHSVGHVNFYPNGGQFQPGCNVPTNLTLNSPISIETAIAIRCCHSRAVFLFLESFCNSGCRFSGINTNSYEHFKNGTFSPRNSATAIMGINAERHENLATGAKVYLDTKSALPFCKL